MTYKFELIKVNTALIHEPEISHDDCYEKLSEELTTQFVELMFNHKPILIEDLNKHFKSNWAEYQFIFIPYGCDPLMAVDDYVGTKLEVFSESFLKAKEELEYAQQDRTKTREDVFNNIAKNH